MARFEQFSERRHLVGPVPNKQLFCRPRRDEKRQPLLILSSKRKEERNIV